MGYLFLGNLFLIAEQDDKSWGVGEAIKSGTKASNGARMSERFVSAYFLNTDTHSIVAHTWFAHLDE